MTITYLLQVLKSWSSPMTKRKIRSQSTYDADSMAVSLTPLEDVIAKARSGELINSLNITALFFALD